MKTDEIVALTIVLTLVGYSAIIGIGYLIKGAVAWLRKHDKDISQIYQNISGLSGRITELANRFDHHLRRHNEASRPSKEE